MTFTDKEQRTILAVLDGILHMPYRELNTFLGSLTIAEATMLYGKMKMAPYCERHGIAYEDLTVEDYEDAYHEGWDS